MELEALWEGPGVSERKKKVTNNPALMFKAILAKHLEVVFACTMKALNI